MSRDYRRGHHPRSRRALVRFRRPGRKNAFPIDKGKGRYAVGLARIWRMLRHLAASADGLTCDELRAEYGITRRLVYRDLVTIKEAGFPLVAEWDTEHHRRYRLRALEPVLGNEGSDDTRIVWAIRVLRELERAGARGRTLTQLSAATESAVLVHSAVTAKPAIVRALRSLERAGVPVFDEMIGAPPVQRWGLLSTQSEVR